MEDCSLFVLPPIEHQRVSCCVFDERVGFRLGLLPSFFLFQTKKSAFSVIVPLRSFCVLSLADYKRVGVHLLQAHPPR